MDYTSIKVGQLPSAAIAGDNFIPHEVEGLLKKATITDLAAFISANGAVGFRAVSVPNGGTLPSTTQQEFILVGPGTYNNVGGGSPVTVTEELNALVSNGTFWFIGVQIPIDPVAGGTANWGDITGTLSAQTDLQAALNAKQPSSADLTSIAGLTGTSGLLRKTAANTYSLDTNSYLPLSGGTLASSGSTNTLNINHSSGSGVAASITKGGNGEALTVVKSSGTGNAASITGGITLLSELNLTTKLADAHINSAATWNAKIGGSGTTNYLPKFTGSSALGNSQIFDNGTNVGIGTTSPEQKLHVEGPVVSKAGSFAPSFIAIGNSNNNGQIQFGSSINYSIGSGSDFGGMDFTVAGTTKLSIKNNGNVGINQTNPTQRLDVNGLINSTNGISVGGLGVSVVWTGTQAAYDAITTKSSTTIYFIQ
jgi:hypothetical protein